MDTVRKQVNRPIMMFPPLFGLEYPPCWEEQYSLILSRQAKRLYELYHWYAVMHAVAQPTSRALRAEVGMNPTYFEYAHQELVDLNLIKYNPGRHIGRVRPMAPQPVAADVMEYYLAVLQNRPAPITASLILQQSEQTAQARWTEDQRNINKPSYKSTSTSSALVKEKKEYDALLILQQAGKGTSSRPERDADGDLVRYTGDAAYDVAPVRTPLSDADIAALRAAQPDVPKSVRLSRHIAVRQHNADAGKSKHIPRGTMRLITDYYHARHLACFGTYYSPTNKKQDALHLYNVITNLRTMINLGHPESEVIPVPYILACIDTFFTAIKFDPHSSAPINQAGWKPAWLLWRLGVCTQFFAEFTLRYMQAHQADESLQYLRVDQDRNVLENYCALRRRFNEIDGRFAQDVGAC